MGRVRGGRLPRGGAGIESRSFSNQPNRNNTVGSINALARKEHQTAEYSQTEAPEASQFGAAWPAKCSLHRVKTAEP
jgi:hypothetical protein